MLKQNSTCFYRHQLQRQLESLRCQSANWSALWKVIVDDSWFDRQLNRIARRMCERTSGGRTRYHSADDVVQEVHLLFAKYLQQHNGINFDPDKANLHTFLSALIRNFCLRTLEIPDKKKPPRSLPNKLSIMDDTWQRSNHAMELRELTNSLPEQVQRSVARFLRGDTIPEIAKHSGYSDRTVYRHLHQAAEMMRDVLQFG